MKLYKAVAIATLGPKTEAQRRQAIATLRQGASKLGVTYQDLAGEFRTAADRLHALGDINKSRMEEQWRGGKRAGT